MRGERSGEKQTLTGNCLRAIMFFILGTCVYLVRAARYPYEIIWCKIQRSIYENHLESD